MLFGRLDVGCHRPSRRDRCRLAIVATENLLSASLRVSNIAEKSGMVMTGGDISFTETCLNIIESLADAIVEK